MKISLLGGSGEKALRGVLEIVVHKGTVTPTEIAEQLGLPKPTVSRHLNTLVAQDLVKRVRKGQRVHYSPQTACQITYLGPLDTDHKTGPTAWGLLEWSSAVAVDWRYPLLTRIRDETARRSIQRLLERCDRQGFFHPWLKHREDCEKWIEEQAKSLRQYLRSAFADSMASRNFEFVVFGSCARGDAREESDVDILVLGPTEGGWFNEFGGDVPALPWKPWKSLLRDIIDEANIASPRYIDATIGDTPDKRAPFFKQMQQKIVEEGITVHTTTGRKLTIESMRSGQHG